MKATMKKKEIQTSDMPNILAESSQDIIVSWHPSIHEEIRYSLPKYFNSGIKYDINPYSSTIFVNTEPPQEAIYSSPSKSDYLKRFYEALQMDFIDKIFINYRLSNKYKLINPDEILSFLSKHKILVDFLRKAPEIIYNHFPNSPLKLQLRTDCETGNTKLFLTASTHLSFKEYFSKMNAIFKDLKPFLSPDISNILNITASSL